MSLLVALVSVLTASVPVLVNAITPKNSDLIFSFQGANAAILSVVATNQGTRPGSVRSGLVSFPDYDLTGEKVVQLSQLGGGPVATVVPPSASLVLNFIRDKSEPMTNLEFQKIKSCELVIWATDFKGSGKPHYLPVECVELAGFVSTQHE